MEKPCWVRTLVVQLALCFALYFALHLGQPQNSVYNGRSESRPLDLYFISVRGGFRPLNQQTHLLKQLEKVAKTYKARFVVNVGELGEDDPLLQNLVSSPKVPWYANRVSKAHEEGGYFLKQVNVSYGKTLSIIGVNTGLLKDVLTGPLNETQNNQLHWLTRTLEETSGNWRIVVGFHPLAVCKEKDEEMEANQAFKTLQQILMKFEVNAYISGMDCSDQGSIGYIENPGPNVIGPFLSLFSNQRSILKRESVDGFLLHRVNSLELVTYFVTSDGEVVHRSILQQRGKEVM
ncbi:Metallo-dependent phosphatase-like [Trema orientale]|uniref:Metallo-dependent phosphatase-like n=1 Tax=Trema orientale TaxID=63057 RepID=A0A2P5F3J0_TREOI|nr:Metallo-dependent phosphatase-like [Trema orientale]